MLLILDFKFRSVSNGRGFQFGILNDALRPLLITIGVFKVGALSEAPRFRSLMAFVKFASVVALVNALRAHFVMPYPPVMKFLFLAISLQSILAIIVFCTAVIQLAEEDGLARAAESWRTTRVLYGVIYLLPLGAFYVTARRMRRELEVLA